MIRRIFLVASCFMLPGCSTLPTSNSEVAVTCDSATCAEKWASAQLWVVKHTSMKLQTVSDAIIDTYDPCLPMAAEAPYGFRILKEPVGNGNYRIIMDRAFYCGFLRVHYGSPESVAQFNAFMRTGNDSPPAKK